MVSQFESFVILLLVIAGAIIWEGPAKNWFRKSHSRTKPPSEV